MITADFHKELGWVVGRGGPEVNALYLAITVSKVKNKRRFGKRGTGGNVKIFKLATAIRLDQYTMKKSTLYI